MEKKRILIDMDHVMADITAQYIIWFQRATGVEMTGMIYWGNRRIWPFRNPG